MAKISVVIPVYNSEKYIEKCIKSLVNQTLKDIEIICVNDGSSDNSRKLLENFADSRIKIIDKKNGGQSSARNIGLDIAQGEYIGFIDSDDWVDADYYEKLYNAAKKYDADIAMADFIRTGSKKHKIRLNLTEEKIYEKIENKIKAANALKEGCIWNKIYKKEILSGLKFTEGMYFEDGPFTIKALYASNKLVTVQGTYYYYFQNPSSTVKTMDKNKRLDKEKSKREILDFIKSKNINIPDKTYWAVSKKFTIADFTLASVQESIKSKRFALFGVIPLWEVKCQK